ncbi:MAG: methyltransferase domain-containing protein [Bdellovibrionaceae bacterium]|nr:methyltransferase domain-containing protein [Pseudobdellovibrionaceae bacterium]
METQRQQEHLAQEIIHRHSDEWLPADPILKAFHRVPRHLFVSRYRIPGTDRWVDVNAENLKRVSSFIYQDRPLILWGSEADFHDGDAPVSTISQPSLVLHLLDLLRLEKGMRVFELGTASGWNAALMAELVGPEGHILTAEIIPELAREARERLQRLKYPQVEVFAGDAFNAVAGKKFDRVIFTAAAEDLPRSFYECLSVGGLLLFVLKSPLGPDHFVLLRKGEEGFQSEKIAPCSFVSVTGDGSVAEKAPAYEEEWHELHRHFGCFVLSQLTLEMRPAEDLPGLESTPDQVVWRRPQSLFIWRRRFH